MAKQTRFAWVKGHGRAPSLSSLGETGAPNETRGFEDATAFCADEGEAFGRFVDYMGPAAVQSGFELWQARQVAPAPKKTTRKAKAVRTVKTAKVEASAPTESDVREGTEFDDIVDAVDYPATKDGGTDRFNKAELMARMGDLDALEAYATKLSAGSYRAVYVENLIDALETLA
jgi:hypothetical protein